MWIQNFFFIWLYKVREKNKKIVYLGNKLFCHGINYLETYKPVSYCFYFTHLM